MALASCEMHCPTFSCSLSSSAVTPCRRSDVVCAVSTGAKHVPYRNHPLTMLMSDSIGGAARTLLAAATASGRVSREIGEQRKLH